MLVAGITLDAMGAAAAAPPVGPEPDGARRGRSGGCSPDRASHPFVPAVVASCPAGTSHRAAATSASRITCGRGIGRRLRQGRGDHRALVAGGAAAAVAWERQGGGAGADTQRPRSRMQHLRVRRAPPCCDRLPPAHNRRRVERGVRRKRVTPGSMPVRPTASYVATPAGARLQGIRRSAEALRRRHPRGRFGDRHAGEDEEGPHRSPTRGRRIRHLWRRHQHVGLHPGRAENRAREEPRGSNRRRTRSRSAPRSPRAPRRSARIGATARTGECRRTRRRRRPARSNRRTAFGRLRFNLATTIKLKV